VHLEDLDGQMYLFSTPSGYPVPNLDPVILSAGAGNNVSRQDCKADLNLGSIPASTLHSWLSDEATALPGCPIIPIPVNSLTVTTDTVKTLNAFARGLLASAGHVRFRRGDDLRCVVKQAIRVGHYGFDGRRWTRYSGFMSLGQGIDTLVRMGFQSYR